MRLHRTTRSVLGVLGLLASACVAGPVSMPQTRCGWFDNPTPGNAWLHDRDGEWTIATQGTYEADGDWPKFKDSQWVRVNGPHGYGCACINAVVNASTRQVVSMSSARARPLSACRADRSLAKPAG